MARQVSCPACRRTIKVSTDKPAKVKCAKCDKVFAVSAAPSSSSVQTDKKPATAAPAKSQTPATRKGSTTTTKRTSSGCLILVAVVGFLGLGAAGAVGAYFLFLHKDREATPLAQ